MPITYSRNDDDSGEGFDGDLPDAATMDASEFDEALSRPLAQYSEAELFAEMELRYSSFIFHGLAHKQHDDETGCYHKYHGSYFTCLGLLVAFKKILKNSL